MLLSTRFGCGIVFQSQRNKFLMKICAPMWLASSNIEYNCCCESVTTMMKNKSTCTFRKQTIFLRNIFLQSNIYIYIYIYSLHAILSVQQLMWKKASKYVLEIKMKIFPKNDELYTYMLFLAVESYDFRPQEQKYNSIFT